MENAYENQRSTNKRSKKRNKNKEETKKAKTILLNNREENKKMSNTPKAKLAKRLKALFLAVAMLIGIVPLTAIGAAAASHLDIDVTSDEEGLSTIVGETYNFGGASVAFSAVSGLPEATFYIHNNEDTDPTDEDITISLSSYTDFQLNGASTEVTITDPIAAETFTSFTIKPVGPLAVNASAYTATVTVSGDNIESALTFTVSITVVVDPTCDYCGVVKDPDCTCDYDHGDIKPAGAWGFASFDEVEFTHTGDQYFLNNFGVQRIDTAGSAWTISGRDLVFTTSQAYKGIAIMTGDDAGGNDYFWNDTNGFEPTPGEMYEITIGATVKDGAGTLSIKPNDKDAQRKTFTDLSSTLDDYTHSWIQGDETTGGNLIIDNDAATRGFIIHYMWIEEIETFTISGTVVDDDDGTPIVGATVTLRDSTEAVVRTTTSIAAGVYTLANVPAGNGYTIRVTNATGFDNKTTAPFDVTDDDITNKVIELTASDLDTCEFCGTKDVVDGDKCECFHNHGKVVPEGAWGFASFDEVEFEDGQEHFFAEHLGVQLMDQINTAWDVSGNDLIFSQHGSGSWKGISIQTGNLNNTGGSANYWNSTNGFNPTPGKEYELTVGMSVKVGEEDVIARIIPNASRNPNHTSPTFTTPVLNTAVQEFKVPWTQAEGATLGGNIRIDNDTTEKGFIIHYLWIEELDVEVELEFLTADGEDEITTTTELTFKFDVAVPELDVLDISIINDDGNANDDDEITLGEATTEDGGLTWVVTLADSEEWENGNTLEVTDIDVDGYNFTLAANTVVVHKDITAPTFESAVIIEDVLTITFSEDLDEDEESIPAGSAFEVMFTPVGGGSPESVDVATDGVTIDGDKVILELEDAAVKGQVVTVEYTQPGSTNPKIQDLAGILLANFGPEAVTNETTADVEFLRIETDDTAGTTDKLIFVFDDEVVDFALSDIDIVNLTDERREVTLSGTPSGVEDNGEWSYTFDVEAGWWLGGDELEITIDVDLYEFDTDTKTVTLERGGEDIILEDIIANGIPGILDTTELTFVFDEDVSALAVADIMQLVNTSRETQDIVLSNPDGADKEWTFTLGGTWANWDELEVVSIVKDGYNFSLEKTKVTVHRDAAPEFDFANINGNGLVMVYDQPLDDESVPEPEAFTVKYDAVEVDVVDVYFDNTNVVLIMETPVKANQTVLLSYDPANAGSGVGVGPIKEAEGVKTAAALEDVKVDNSTEDPLYTIDYVNETLTLEGPVWFRLSPNHVTPPTRAQLIANANNTNGFVREGATRTINLTTPLNNSTNASRQTLYVFGEEPSANTATFANQLRAVTPITLMRPATPTAANLQVDYRVSNEAILFNGLDAANGSRVQVAHNNTFSTPVNVGTNPWSPMYREAIITDGAARVDVPAFRTSNTTVHVRVAASQSDEQFRSRPFNIAIVPPAAASRFSHTVANFVNYAGAPLGSSENFVAGKGDLPVGISEYEILIRLTGNSVARWSLPLQPTHTFQWRLWTEREDSGAWVNITNGDPLPTALFNPLAIGTAATQAFQIRRVENTILGIAEGMNTTGSGFRFTGNRNTAINVGNISRSAGTVAPGGSGAREFIVITGDTLTPATVTLPNQVLQGWTPVVGSSIRIEDWNDGGDFRIFVRAAATATATHARFGNPRLVEWRLHVPVDFDDLGFLTTELLSQLLVFNTGNGRLTINPNIPWEFTSRGYARNSVVEVSGNGEFWVRGNTNIRHIPNADGTLYVRIVGNNNTAPSVPFPIVLNVGNGAITEKS
jgi:hypothetical protein